MNLSERLKIILSENGLSQREFALTLGVTENYISLLINGKKEKISETLALLIQEKYGYNAEWVMTGQGEKMKSQKDNFLKQKTIALLKTLSEEEIQAVFAFLNSLDEVKKILQNASDEITATTFETFTESSEIYTHKYKIPLIGRVAGGKPILAVEDCSFIESNIECDCALELVGDSMEPDFKEGDVLLIKRQHILENGELGIILILDGAEIAEATFKKFYCKNGSVLLKSLNSKYDTIEIKSKDIIIFGKVVGKV